MRPIDADELHPIELDLMLAVPYEDIKDAPTVDAIEVVRCGECKHYNKILNMPMCKRTFTNFPMNKDDFCSYGERKEASE